MEFVSFEIAKKLKEKGFREKCIAYYWEKINEHTPSFLVEDNMPEDGLNLLDLLCNHNKAECSHFIDAPTITQVLNWLGDEKQIYILVEPFPSIATKDKVCWSWSFKWNSDGVNIDHSSPSGFTYLTSKEAVLAGIMFLII